nr:uncharacterized protein LOC127339048 [Lolium perenne]
MVKELLRIGAQFVGYREYASQTEEKLAEANKLVDTLTQKFEQSEMARKKAELDASQAKAEAAEATAKTAGVEDLQKRLADAEAALDEHKPMVKELLRIGAQFVGYREYASQTEEKLAEANKLVDTLTQKFEQSEMARKKAELDASQAKAEAAEATAKTAGVEDLQKRLADAEAALDEHKGISPTHDARRHTCFTSATARPRAQPRTPARRAGRRPGGLYIGEQPQAPHHPQAQAEEDDPELQAALTASRERSDLDELAKWPHLAETLRASALEEAARKARGGCPGRRRGPSSSRAHRRGGGNASGGASGRRRSAGLRA